MAMTDHDLFFIERYFQSQLNLLGNLADEESFQMIFDLIAEVRRSQAECQKLTALNRHYYFKFYDSDIEKMKADNAYLLEE